MGDRREIARQHWRDLLPTAYLLTGDQTSARQLVIRTLSRRIPGTGDTVDISNPGKQSELDNRSEPGKQGKQSEQRKRAHRRSAGNRGSRDATHRAAVAALVRTHRRRRPVAGSGRIVGDLPAPWWADPADLAAAHDMARRLDDLPRDDRTALVLRWAEGWTPDEVTALVPGVDLDDLARQLGPAVEHRLDTLAGLCDTTGLDDDTVADEVRRTTRRRARRTTAGAALAAALVGAAVWAPTVLPATPTAPAPGSASRSAEPVPPRGIYALPPLGALAGLADLLAGAQDRLTADGLPGEEYRLVYGDDVDGVRTLLVAAPSGGGVDAAWLTGPAGADPADLQVDHADTAGPAGSSAAAVTVPRPDGAGFVLVALTDPGSTVRLSPGLDVDPATGTAQRTFTDLVGTGGVATSTVDRSSDAGVQLQLLGSGLAVQFGPTSAGDRGPDLDVGVDPLPSRSGAATASPDVVGSAVATVATATGWAVRDLDVVVLGSGVLTAGDGRPAEVAAVAVVLPGGAVVTTTAVHSRWTQDDGSTVTVMSTDCGSSAHPAGTDLTTLVVAATCSFQSAAGSTSRVAVVAAPPGRSVQLDFADGGAPLEPVLTDGFGLVPDLPARGLATATDGTAVVPVAGPGRDVLTG